MSITSKKPTTPSLWSWMEDAWDSRFTGKGAEWFRQEYPAMNVKENDTNFQIEFAAPGLNKDDFEISVHDGILSVSAEKKSEKETSEDNYTRREFNYSSFTRSVSLPEAADAENVQAKYRDGVLHIELAKTSNTTNKRSIKVD